MTISVTAPVVDAIGSCVGADKCELSERFHLQDYQQESVLMLHQTQNITRKTAQTIDSLSTTARDNIKPQSSNFQTPSASKKHRAN